jgi:hypothetical protein
MNEKCTQCYDLAFDYWAPEYRRMLKDMVEKIYDMQKSFYCEGIFRDSCAAAYVAVNQHANSDVFQKETFISHGVETSLGLSSDEIDD